MRDATVEAAGLLGGITGSHFDLIIADDLIDDESTRTKSRMDNVEKWFKGTVEPLLEPQGRMIVVGTRKHPNDLYGRLIEDSGYRIIHDKALVRDESQEEGYRALWPERWPVKLLLEKKRKIGSVMFKREYQNDPRAVLGQLLKEEWLQYYDEPPEQLRVYQGWDLAISKSEKAHYTVCTTIGVDQNENVYVLDWLRAKMDFPTQLRALKAQNDRWAPELIGVEDVAYQRALPQEALRRWRLPLRRIKPDTDKTRRVLSAFVAFENGKVYLPSEHPHLQDFLNEYLEFDAGEYDDMLDSLVIALKVAERKPHRRRPIILGAHTRPRRL